MFAYHHLDAITIIFLLAYFKTEGQWISLTLGWYPETLSADNGICLIKKIPIKRSDQQPGLQSCQSLRAALGMKVLKVFIYSVE